MPTHAKPCSRKQIESIKKIAHLARLEFDENSADKMAKEMSQILDWVEQLSEVDTTDVEPLTTMSSEVNDMREDKVGNHLSHEEALKNAKSEIDMARATSELAVLAAQLSALRKYRKK